MSVDADKIVAAMNAQTIALKSIVDELRQLRRTLEKVANPPSSGAGAALPSQSGPGE